MIENKWDIKFIQILPTPTKGATENIGEGFHYQEIVKVDVFETPDSKTTTINTTIPPFYPSQLKPLFNTILIMFFIGFPILSYLH